MGLLAIVLGLIVQIVHTHTLPNQFGKATADRHSYLAANDQNPDTCSLCVAAHSSAPTSAVSSIDPPPTTSDILSPRVEQGFDSQTGYPHFSRPPPAPTR